MMGELEAGDFDFSFASADYSLKPNPEAADARASPPKPVPRSLARCADAGRGRADQSIATLFVVRLLSARPGYALRLRRKR